MLNLSQMKRKRMLEFLDKIKEEHINDDEMLIALGEIENELNSKKYGLVWEEHEEQVDVQMRTHIPVFTEITEREIAVAPEKPYNFLFEGDNLHSLYLLEKTHNGKIDVIYIDPPYNTGKSFIYDDKMIGNDDAYKHSKWLSFMDKRLRIAQKLLKLTGVIFISIGETEISNLKLLCDDIFGEANCLGIVPRLMKTGGNKGRFFSPNIDYILVYAKNESQTGNFKADLDEALVKKLYNKIETKGERKGERYRPFGLYQSSLDERPNQRYYVECPDGTFAIPPGKTMPAKTLDGEKVLPNKGDGCWRWSQDRYIEEKKKGNLVFIESKEGVLIQPDGSKSKWNVYTKIWLSDRAEEGQTPTNFIGEFENRHSAKEIKDIGLNFDFAKPTKLIKYLFSLTRIGNGGVFLDFFAGSGTTGQAVLELNKEDGGNRKFILCTNNESQICDNVTYPRIKTIITGKRADGSTYSDGIPSNLKYYKTDFVSKNEEMLSDALLEHIKEMVQLEHMVKIDGKNYVLLLDDESADCLEDKWKDYPDLKGIYISKNVLLTASQNELFNSVEMKVIPDYYFNFELKEVGEAW